MADWTTSAMFQCWRIIAFLLLCVSVHSVQDLESCLEVKKTYAAKGFPESDIPRQAVIGDSLEVCAQQETCCPRVLEDRLKSLSQKEHSAHLDAALGLLRTVFTSKTKKFDQFFTALLDNARSELHEMFVKTYGLLYQQNAQIFRDLFDDLRAYYKGHQDHNLAQVMESFFSKLLQKMFTLLNGQYTFDDGYLTCVTERMSDLKPFGEVPVKLSMQIKRAFIAARTFVQGLAIGRDVILNIMEIPPTEQCVKGVLRMSHCPKCRGLTQTRPCNNLCLNTMKGCLAHHAELNAVWNSYIDALKNLAKRLEGPFNIESVVDPIDVKISDAIMNMQENSEKVSTRIFNGCGKPPMARKKREADKNINIYNFDFSSKPRPRPTTAAGTSLDRLVKDIKEKVKTAKDFWVRLPYNICNDEEVAAPPDTDDCWNGHNRARYVPNVQKDGVMNQMDNPEVEVDVSRASTLFTRQVIQLRLITSRLNLAYNGEDVDWIDIPDDAAAMSGSGSGDDGASLPISSSGSGSGGGDSHWDSDDEDDFHVDNKPRPQATPYPPYFTRPPHSGGGGGGGGSGGGRKPTPPKDKGDGATEGSGGSGGGGGSVLRASSWTVVVVGAVAGVWFQSSLLLQQPLLLPPRWS